MNITPNPARSFFSITAWYAVVAALAAAAISGVGWFIFFYSDQGSSWSLFFDSSVAFTFVTADFVSLTSAVASFVCLFGLRRHGWRVIVWKSLVGFALSCLVFAAPSLYLIHEPLVISKAVPTQNPVTMRVDKQDLDTAANGAVQSLLASGVFDRVPHNPAVLSFGRIVNNTAQYIDMDLVTGAIRASLVKTGKVVVSGKGQNTLDTMPVTGSTSRPDFTLAGKLIETIDHTGNINQSSYVFQFSLADSNNLMVWEDEKTITKLSNSNQRPIEHIAH